MEAIKAGIEEAAKRKMLKLSSIKDLHKFGALNARKKVIRGQPDENGQALTVKQEIAVMARRKAPKPSKTKRAGTATPDESRLPSPDPVTNLVIADIVLRGAGSLLRQRLERGLLTGQLESDKAKRLVESRSMVSALALWGASRLATRSPLGLAVVAGGLAAKAVCAASGGSALAAAALAAAANGVAVFGHAGLDDLGF